MHLTKVVVSKPCSTPLFSFENKLFLPIMANVEHFSKIKVTWKISGAIFQNACHWLLFIVFGNSFVKIIEMNNFFIAVIVLPYYILTIGGSIFG